MKFEFVEFYEATEERKSKISNKLIGTVHIYLIDCELDIRGIYVKKQGKQIYFHLPHFSDIDNETGEKVKYPHIRFVNQKKQSEMLDFLHKVVKPKILDILNSKIKK
jgi:hypothetical protein